LLSGCHDGVLGFGSDLAFQKRLQRLGVACSFTSRTSASPARAPPIRSAP
jgi:hypothetical protein